MSLSASSICWHHAGIGISVFHPGHHRGSLLGCLGRSNIPSLGMVIGAAIVTLTSLYLLRHEAFRRGPPCSTRAARPVAASAQVRQVIGKFDELRIVGRLQYLDHDRLVGAPRAALVLAQGL